MFWNQAEKISKKALSSGDLLPVATDACYIQQNEVNYKVHTKNDNALKKIFEAKTTGNPFLPYDESMFVSDAGDSHVCLLNRFPVLNNHLLICSRDFERQVLPITQENFEAWLLGFDGEDVLGFYNGGPNAGASQPHRHMQLVKTSIALEDPIVSGELPFTNKLFKFDSIDAAALYSMYIDGMEDLQLFGKEECLPYNLILRPNWMLIVPRKQTSFNNVFLNGLNYCGTFLVRNEEQRLWAEEFGFMNILRECAITK